MSTAIFPFPSLYPQRKVPNAVSAALTVVATLSCLIAAILCVRETGLAESVSLTSGRFDWQKLQERQEGVLGDAGHKQSKKKLNSEIHRELSTVSSSSLVQKAAAECASDPKCIPSVDELVKRAAASCATDASCVCDWGQHPKQCFLSEVQRHHELVRYAKQLEERLKAQSAIEKKKEAIESLVKAGDDGFTAVIHEGRQYVGSKNFEAAKHELAKAEYLHELTVRRTKDTNGPVMTREEEELRRFAREIVEAEAEDRERERRHDDARREENRREESRRVSQLHEEGSSKAATTANHRVESQISQLTKNVAKLMHVVGTLSQKKEMETIQKRSSDSPRSEILALTKDIAVLTGKVGELEHSKLATHPQAAVQFKGVDPAIEHTRTSMLVRQESLFAQSIAKGERAASQHKMKEAKGFLDEARYFHSELIRLRKESPSTTCLPCESLEKKIETLSERHVEKAPRDSHPEFEDSATIEQKFDTALASGQRARIHGDFKDAKKEEGDARRLLRTLSHERLPRDEMIVKQEMSQALHSLAKGIRKGEEESYHQRDERRRREEEEKYRREMRGESSDGGKRELHVLARRKSEGRREGRQDEETSRFARYHAPQVRKPSLSNDEISRIYGHFARS